MKLPASSNRSNWEREDFTASGVSCSMTCISDITECETELAQQIGGQGWQLWHHPAPTNSLPQNWIWPSETGQVPQSWRKLWGANPLYHTSGLNPSKSWVIFLRDVGWCLPTCRHLWSCKAPEIGTDRPQATLEKLTWELEPLNSVHSFCGVKHF